MRKPEDVHVLVVDDESDVRDYLCDVLTDAGMQVTTAQNGTEALEFIRQRIPDLVSTDLVMPGKSGIRLIHELRKNKEWSRIPILIVTGHARDADIKKGLDGVLAGGSIMGPSTCLEKPITPQGYLSAVCRLLDVELPESVGLAESESLRRQAEQMLRDADQDTLKKILAQLKSKQKDS